MTRPYGRVPKDWPPKNAELLLCRRGMSFRLFILILIFSVVYSLQCEKFVKSNRPHRKISYMGNILGAGLYDRYNIIHGLIRLANKTGSRVYIPPPCELLSREHNQNKNVGCWLKWSDFLDVSEFSNVLLTSKPPDSDLQIVNYYHECWSWFASGPTKPYLLLKPAPFVKSAATRFIRKWLPGPFSFVHLRLGNDHENCDQGQPAILKRLSGLRMKLAGHHLALSSKSPLSSYFLKKVGNATNTTVVSVDPILRNSSDARISGNNYLIFNLETEIMKRAMYTIEWHRKFACGTVVCLAACRNVSNLSTIKRRL